MGIDTALAIDKLDDEFVCSICHDILHDPVVISSCEHYFCNSCIRPWIQANSTCPKDRNLTEETGIGQACRFFRNKLADVRLRCQFSGCNAEINYEGFDRHKNECRENPDVWMECTLCHDKHMKDEEDTHKKSCIPFLRETIDKTKSEKTELEREFRRKREADKKHYEEIERMAKKPRTLRYVFTWNAEFPSPRNHQDTDDYDYYIWSGYNNLLFELDHGEMEVGLCIEKGTGERSICTQFFLTTRKKGRVKFNWSLSVGGKVTNVEDGWTGGNIFDVLPSDLPSKVLVLIEVIEWEPNTE